MRELSSETKLKEESMSLLRRTRSFKRESNRKMIGWTN